MTTETSIAAYYSVENITTTQQCIVYLLERYGPMTDQELYRAYGESLVYKGWPYVSESGLRTRRSELVGLGIIEDSTRRGLTFSNRQTIIWQLTERPTQ